MRPPLRVVLADDHAFYRMGLARLLQARGVDVVAQAPDGAAAIRAVQETAPDVVVLDLKMPRMSGIEAARLLTERSPTIRVLVLSVSAEDTDVADAILAGACSYLLKDRPADELVAAIQAAAAGACHISPQVAVPLLRSLGGPARAGRPPAGTPFAPDELELLDLLAEDRSDQEIAGRLGIGVGSLQARASDILARLQVEQQLRPLVRASRDEPR